VSAVIVVAVTESAVIDVALTSDKPFIDWDILDVPFELTLII
jgi:hypothetical protein